MPLTHSACRSNVLAVSGQAEGSGSWSAGASSFPRKDGSSKAATANISGTGLDLPDACSVLPGSMEKPLDAFWPGSSAVCARGVSEAVLVAPSFSSAPSQAVELTAAAPGSSSTHVDGVSLRGWPPSTFRAQASSASSSCPPHAWNRKEAAY